jgi:hypothetical protein
MATLAFQPTRPRAAVWTGRILSGIAALFMTFDGVIHIAKPAVVVQAFAQLGYPDRRSVGLGVVALVCVAIYVAPRTAVLGAVLLTGYLGGAVATQLRIGAPAFSVLFPCIVATLFWAGLILRSRKAARWLLDGIGE